VVRLYQNILGEIKMSDTNIGMEQQTLVPNPDLRSLDKLVGTWKISGGSEVTVTYEWMEGGFFLIQHIDLNQAKGIEIIGHLRPYGEEPSKDIKSRYYASAGETLDYVYEVTGNTLMIWFGEKGSPAHFKGEFSEDGNTLTGGWVYPGGGGYETISTRVK
jgi:hypothetical protein